MTRSALARLLRRVAIASPLLVAPGCSINLSDCVAPEITTTESLEFITVDVDAGCEPDVVCPFGGPPCGRRGATCTFANGDGGLVALCHYPEEHYSCNRSCTGRRPAGLREPVLQRGGTLGAHFAGVAFLEAASVEAFRRLRAELVRHGAPAALVRAAARAERDEVRHARITAALAREHGVEPPPVEVDDAGELEARDLEVVARENVVEGCVSESFGAVVGWWQSRHAATARLRAIMDDIACDERRHAELSFAVDRWARGLLNAAARARLDEARAGSIDRVGAGLASPVAPAVAVAVGLPQPEVSAALFQMAREELWSQAG